MRDLNYKDKLEYLQNNVPDKSVIELQNEIAKSIGGRKTYSASGFLGKNKLEGTVRVNTETGMVSFFDRTTNRFRTIVKMVPDEIIGLVYNDFHLFPDV